MFIVYLRSVLVTSNIVYNDDKAGNGRHKNEMKFSHFRGECTWRRKIGKFFADFTISRLISELSLDKNFSSCESDTIDLGKSAYLYLGDRSAKLLQGFLSSCAYNGRRVINSKPTKTDLWDFNFVPLLPVPGVETCVTCKESIHNAARTQTILKKFKGEWTKIGTNYWNSLYE